MNRKRIAQLERNLEGLYNLLGAADEGIIRSQSTVAAAKYKMEIQDDIRPKIRAYEEEYFQILQQMTPELTFVEADAQGALDVIAQEVERVNQQAAQYPPDLLILLQKIEAKLNEPGITADAKLKGTLSLFPPFVALSYEAQLDTENFFRKNFPTFRRLIKGAKK